LRDKVGSNAHSGGHRATLEHHEAGRDEGPAAGEPAAKLTWCSATPPNLGWSVSPKRWRPWATKWPLTTISTASCGRIAGAARAGDQVLVMSNGDFGGIHEKLLAALAADVSAQEMVSQQAAKSSVR
jgi:hypothetical protein